MSTEPDINAPSEDETPHIRTYAKDFAIASGKTPAPERAKKESKKEKAGKVTVEKPIQPVIVPLPPIPSVPTPIVEIPKYDIPAPLPPVRPEPAIPVYIPPTPAPAVTPVAASPTPVVAPIPRPAPAEVSISEREAILARLKARIPAPSTSIPAYVPPITPTVAAAPAPIMPIVESVSYREPLPVTTEIPPIPAPVEPTPIPITPEGPAALHTYTSDFADRIDEKKASRFSVLAAEKDAHVRMPQARKSIPWIPIVSGILLLVIGSGAVVAAYIYMSKSAPALGITAPPSLITPDSKVALIGSGATLFQALATQATEPLQVNTVELTYINISTTTPQGIVEEPGTGGAFITEMDLPAPDILLRNIDPSSMVGIVNAGGNTSPFFILRVTSYERTFAGMLSWETTMEHDLASLYPRYPAPAVTPVVTTVATTSSATTTKSSVTKTTSVIITTAPAVDPTEPAAQFVDETVANHDVRALKDMSGRTIVLYGYADKQTLIICRDEAAFSLLLGRLAVNAQ